MVISRKWAVFLIGVGVWTWLIWPRFGLAIYDDDRAFRNGTPTAFLWVHAVLIVASLVIGTAVGVLGIRAWRAGRPGIGRVAEAEEFVASGAGRPQD
jgi:hypothetical protein